jgi:hypothetical protein
MACSFFLKYFYIFFAWIYFYHFFSLYFGFFLSLLYLLYLLYLLFTFFKKSLFIAFNSILGAVPGVTGEGVVAKMDFQALAQKTGTITLDNIVALDANGAPIATTAQNANVTVPVVPPPQPPPQPPVPAVAVPIPTLSPIGLMLLSLGIIILFTFWGPQKLMVSHHSGGKG